MKVRVCHNHIEILDYELGDRRQLEKRFQLWNKPYHRYEDVFIFYNEDEKILYLPRGINYNQIFNDLDDIEIIYEPNPYDKVDMVIYQKPRDDFQTTAINFLIGEGFTNSRMSSQIVLTAPPGSGKTYCAIASMCYYKMRTIIIVHRNKILEQWKEAILSFTNIKDNEILELDALALRYLSTHEMPKNIKVILASHQTFTMVGNSEGWDIIKDFLKNSRVGLKIVDEAHRHVRNSFLIDAHAYIKKNIYLTATFNRSDYKEDKLFQDAFANIPKYGKESIISNRKHIMYIMVTFDSKPQYDEIASLKGYNGYFDKNKYIEYQINKGFIEQALVKLYDIFGKNEGRTLILSPKITSSKYFANVMSKNFKDKKVYVYNSSISQEDKLEAMEKADIISGIPSSLGEGTNMAGLRYLYMIEPYSSSVNAFQNPSRLRPYAPDKLTFYIEFIDEGLQSIIKWHKRRMAVFKKYFHSERHISFEDLMDM